VQDPGNARESRGKNRMLGWGSGIVAEYGWFGGAAFLASLPARRRRMEEIRERALGPRARTTGAVYLLYFLTAILSQALISRKVVVYGNVANFVADACYIAVTLLFYGLFKPVSRVVSLVAACLSLAGCVVMVGGQLHLGSNRFSPLVFFGPFCILIGYLILRSTFLPRLLGVLMALAGVGWLIFPIPSLPHLLSLSIEGLGIFAEGALMLWLLVMGVKVGRWKEQAEGR
jgi:hypothetical protein